MAVVSVSSAESAGMEKCISRSLPETEDALPPLLSVRGLEFSFSPGQPLFQGLDFDIGEGEFVSLLAPSGLGKTTLFRLIAGLLQPDKGTIAVREIREGQLGVEAIGTYSTGTAPMGANQTGENRIKPNRGRPSPGQLSPGQLDPIQPGNKAERPEARILAQTSRPGQKRRTSPIGYMPQNDCLMPWRSVLDNAVLGLEMSGVSRRQARQTALALLPEFGLAGTEDKMPHELSGGMRQRVSFMRCMLGGGSLLLLDEPFGALDAMTRVAMQEWLLDIWEKRRQAVLFITHDVDEALLLSDRLLIAPQRPVSGLLELAVDRPRPRRYPDLLTPPYIKLKEQALALLTTRSVMVPGGEAEGGLL